MSQKLFFRFGFAALAIILGLLLVGCDDSWPKTRFSGSVTVNDRTTINLFVEYRCWQAGNTMFSNCNRHQLQYLQIDVSEDGKNAAVSVRPYYFGVRSDNRVWGAYANEKYKVVIEYENGEKETHEFIWTADEIQRETPVLINFSIEEGEITVTAVERRG